MKYLLLFFFILFFKPCLQAQTFNYAFTQGGLDNQNGVKLTTDAQGNIYQLIQYDTAFTIDSAGTPILIKSNFLYTIGLFIPPWYPTELALVKYDSNGKYQWHIYFDMHGVGDEFTAHSFKITGIKADISGNVYFSGSYFIYDSLDFISSNKTIAYRYRQLSNKPDVGYLLKVNNNGIIQWVNTSHSNSYSAPVVYNRFSGLSIDVYGNTYIHFGYYDNANVSSQNGTNHFYYDTINPRSLIIKYDSNGLFKSFNQLITKQGIYATNIHSMVSDSFGYLYALMEFNPPTKDTLNLPTGYVPLIASTNYLVAKADTAGNWLWASAVYVGISNNPVLAINKKGNKLFLGHTFSDQTFYSAYNWANGLSYYTNNGGTDIFISCIDTSGTELWEQTFGGTGDDTLFGIACNTQQDVFLLGETNSPQLNFGNSKVNTVSNNSIFVAQFDASGNNLNAQSINGRVYLNQPSGSGALYITNKNKGYFTGFFYDSIKVGCSTIISKGNSDAFIIEYLPAADTVFIKSCSPYNSPSHKYVWKTSGNYIDTVRTAKGCDSVLTINLTILNTKDSITKTFCRSYISPSGKYTYTNSGKYFDTIPNSKNCDSVITLNLISLSTKDSIQVSFCRSYLSPSGKYTYTNSGKYFDTIPNSKSCDSIITLNLTLLNRSMDSIAAGFCKSYVSPSGKYTYTTSGKYFDTLTNSKGCDSIIIINLFSNKNSDSVFVKSCTNYTSPSGKNVYTLSGKYFDTIPNSKNCDSIIIINYTKLSTANSININKCDTFKSPSGKYMYSVSGIFIDTIQNSNNCDSIITINLTISKPIVKATKSNDIDCTNKLATLLATGATKYSWSPNIALSNNQISNPFATPIISITYTVIGTDTNNCTNTDSIIVNVILSSSNQRVPNVFTPNGDGMNECFSIDSANTIKSLSFYIFNRWGDQVFYSANPEGCWDGKNENGQSVSDGTYFYIIEGETNCGLQFKMRGTVLLVR